MTVELEEKLTKETEEALEELKKFDKDSEEYGHIMEQIRKNCEVLIKSDQVGFEEARANDDRLLQKELKERELEQTKKDKWTHIAIEGAKVVVPTAVSSLLYYWMFMKGMQFEQEGTVTSLFFKNALNRIKPV